MAELLELTTSGQNWNESKRYCNSLGMALADLTTPTHQKLFDDFSKRSSDLVQQKLMSRIH